MIEGNHQLGPAEARVVRRGRRFFVEGLYVPRLLRGRGHATRLLRRLLAEAEAEGVELRAVPMAWDRLSEEELEQDAPRFAPDTDRLRDYYARLGLLP